MENENKQIFTINSINNKSYRQRVRSISPCLQRKDYVVESFLSKKQSFNIHQNNQSVQPLPNQFFSKSHSIQQPSLNNYFLNQNQTHLDRSTSNQFSLQGKGININLNSQQIQNENVFQMYQDVFNHENNRFRSQTPNKWAKNLGTIRQKNENSYIMNQIQLKKNIANQNKDLLILPNMLEKKQVDYHKQNSLLNNNYSTFSNLQTLPITPSPMNDENTSCFLQQYYKFNIEKQDSQIMNTNSINQTIQFEESPEKSIILHSPQCQKSNSSHSIEKTNIILQDSPTLGGETAHFNNFLQNAQLDSNYQSIPFTSQQSRKLIFGQNDCIKEQNSKKNSIFDKQFLYKNSSQIYKKQNNYLFSRSETPSSRPLIKTQAENFIYPIIKQRTQLKLNKSNVNDLAERSFSPDQTISKKRIQTQINDTKIENDLDDSLIFQHNNENLFKKNQQINIQKQNQSKKKIRILKETISQIIQTENEDENGDEISQSKEKYYNIKNIRSHKNNPSVVQCTPKSNMQRYSKVPRFISVKNRVIRYPTFTDIMQNTTTDHTFEILKKNKLITNGFNI